eukprot:2342454-Rhodomonas_salina.1
MTPNLQKSQYADAALNCLWGTQSTCPERHRQKPQPQPTNPLDPTTTLVRAHRLAMKGFLAMVVTRHAHVTSAAL